MSITDSPSDTNPSLDSVLAEVQAEVGQNAPDPNTETQGAVEEEVSSGETEEQPVTYTVRVDGKDVEVPLNELTDGYLRHSDYTRKTQALAEERQRYQHFDALDRAFQEDPIGTLRDLSNALGVSPEKLVEGTNPNRRDIEIDPDDPVAAQLREIQEWRRNVDQREEQRAVAERQAAVDRELEAVKVKFNAPNLDERALLEFALENRIQSLEIAYELLDARAAKAAPPKPEKKLDQKRKAPKVEGGTNRDVGVKPGSSDRMSLQEALNAAIKERDS